MSKWFVTWDRQEYKEWAKEMSGGYSLLIIRREPNDFLCVRAKLIMGEKGLPDFKVVKEHRFPTKQKADKQIQDWKK